MFCCFEPKFEKQFPICDHFLLSYCDLNIAIFANIGHFKGRYMSRYKRVSDLFRHRNHSKLFEGSLFAIIDLLLLAKSIKLYSIWRVGDHFCKIFSLYIFFFHFFIAFKIFMLLQKS